METKICKICGIEKPLESFRKRDRWYLNVCRQCENEQCKKRNKENADKYSIAQKKYRFEHKEHYNELNRKRYSENREKILENQKQLNQKHKELNDEVYQHKQKYKKEYRENHRDEISAQLAEWRKNNDKKIKEYRLQHSEERKQYMDLYREENSEQLREWRQEYRKKNLERIKDYMSSYREENKERIKEYNKNYKDENKEKLSQQALEYYKTRRINDPLFRLKMQVRGMIRGSFNRRGQKKRKRTEEILGCTIDEFANHLLDTYIDNYGIEWDGTEEVHIDHIIPLATATTEEEVINLCHYSNLQLLKAKDNMDKRDSLNWELNERE